MLDYIKKHLNKKLTENGAVTYETTTSDCLDLFATIGALRSASDEEIITRFSRAYIENPDIAMKLLFFARDIRGGLGERRVFRVIVNWLGTYEPKSIEKNIKYIAEFGRYDDLLALMNTTCEEMMLTYIKDRYMADCIALDKGEKISLLAKWLPSVNASNAQTVKNAKKITRFLKISDATYRKQLATMRRHIKIIENNLRECDYTFNYEMQPSRALYKYRKAFIRNDSERYDTFLEKVEKGEARLNAENIAPYELVAPYLNMNYGWNGDTRCYMRNVTVKEKRALNATWDSLPDYGGDEDCLTVIDTSGSMYWDTNPSPAAVALSLGLYFAERNKGLFRNHFIEFSNSPRLIEIKGRTFADKLRYVSSFSQVANTNLEAVFDLILNVAIKNNVSQKQLPSKLIIISDMEFDVCVDNSSMTNFENAKAKYKKHGYKLPEIVFWNVASRNRQQPVSANEQGVCLISGATPKLFSMVASGNLSPYTFMMEILSSKRYADIAA